MGNCKPGCKGMKMALLGLIILINARLSIINWWELLGGLLVLKGVLMVVMQGKCVCRGSRGCCSKESCEPKSEKKKKK